MNATMQSHVFDTRYQSRKDGDILSLKTKLTPSVTCPLSVAKGKYSIIFHGIFSFCFKFHLLQLLSIKDLKIKPAVCSTLANSHRKDFDLEQHEGQ